VWASFIFVVWLVSLLGAKLFSVNNSALNLINSQFFYFFFEAYGCALILLSISSQRLTIYKQPHSLVNDYFIMWKIALLRRDDGPHALTLRGRLIVELSTPAQKPLPLELRSIGMRAQ
jgi:hypothetical protein